MSEPGLNGFLGFRGCKVSQSLADIKDWQMR